MEKNKTGKYFKYAIGEIILVVIGILIALSINNWNEHRLERIEEKSILEAIKVDYKNAIVEFKELNQNRLDLENASQTIFTIINANEIKFSKNELDSILSILLIGPTYNSQTKTLEVLFNSGKINLITNSDIKDKLINWPKLVDDMKEGEIQSIEVLRDKIIPLLYSYVSLFDLNRQFKFKDYDLFNKNLQSAYSSNYRDLFTDRNFENVLSLRQLYNNIALIETNELINEANSIIELINNNLNLQYD